MVHHASKSMPVDMAAFDPTYEPPTLRKMDVQIEFRSKARRTICVGVAAPDALRDAVQSRGVWTKHDFDVTQLIGKSASVWVYKGTCKFSQTAVALKCYRKDHMSTLNHRQVEREIQIHAALKHPAICCLYGAFEDELYIYLVQELCMGGDLFHRLLGKKWRAMSEEHLVQTVIEPLLSALVYLHSASIIHRDIKPENLLFLDKISSVLKMTDFGLSIDQAEERPVSRVGTLDYMPPEVLLCPYKTHPSDNKDNANIVYDEKTDVWAVGVLAFELLTGCPPFPADEQAQKRNNIITSEPVYPSMLSALAIDFIKIILNKRRRLRPSAAELLNHPWIVKGMCRPQAPLQQSRSNIAELVQAKLDTAMDALNSGRPNAALASQQSGLDSPRIKSVVIEEPLNSRSNSKRLSQHNLHADAPHDAPPPSVAKLLGHGKSSAAAMMNNVRLTESAHTRNQSLAEGISNVGPLFAPGTKSQHGPTPSADFASMFHDSHALKQKPKVAAGGLNVQVDGLLSLGPASPSAESPMHIRSKHIRTATMGETHPNGPIFATSPAAPGHQVSKSFDLKDIDLQPDVPTSPKSFKPSKLGAHPLRTSPSLPAIPGSRPEDPTQDDEPNSRSSKFSFFKRMFQSGKERRV